MFAIFPPIQQKPPLLGGKGKLNPTITTKPKLHFKSISSLSSNAVRVRQTYLYPFNFMAKCPCPRNSKPSCQHHPLPKFLFTAELTDKRTSWCPPRAGEFTQGHTKLCHQACPGSGNWAGGPGGRLLQGFLSYQVQLIFLLFLTLFQGRSSLKHNPRPSFLILQLNLQVKVHSNVSSCSQNKYYFVASG